MNQNVLNLIFGSIAHTMVNWKLGAVWKSTPDLQLLKIGSPQIWSCSEIAVWKSTPDLQSLMIGSPQIWSCSEIAVWKSTPDLQSLKTFFVCWWQTVTALIFGMLENCQLIIGSLLPFYSWKLQTDN